MVVWPGYDYWVCRHKMNIHTEPLTGESFKPYGDVLQTEGLAPELINRGKTKKFADLAGITLAQGGQAQLSIYRSSAIELPFRIRMVERHPLGSQAFFPLHKRPFPVVVAMPGTIPGPDSIRVFLTNGRQGVNIHPGVWHHYQLSLGEESEYIVFDRGGPGENCDEYHLEQELILNL
jgi:ureidoglycolate lyase